MPETKEKQCPFDRQLKCENCRLYLQIAGQNPECMVASAARQLFMIYSKGASGGMPFYSSRG